MVRFSDPDNPAFNITFAANKKCPVFPENLENDRQIPMNDKLFLLDYCRYMYDKFSVRISASSTFNVPDHTLDLYYPIIVNLLPVHPYPVI
jgi:hypothetical protein